MPELGIILLTNAATATVLGIAVACVARRLRYPAAVHALWVVVLLDLLAPPIFEIGVLPAELTAAAASGNEAAGPAPASEAPLELDFSARGRSSRPAPATVATEARSIAAEVGRWIPAIWLAGFAVALALALVRTRRFARLVRRARPAPAALEARLAVLAEQAGLRGAPRLRVVRACLPPMLRWQRGRLEILFPLALLRRLEPAERDALLLHELAHVRRRDPWVRVLELAATCLFWWHPLVFWARRSLRRAEEMSCDAWVLRWLPGHGRAYAEGLLETLEFLSGSGSRVPALASGAGDFRGLEERLTMIVKDRRPPALVRPLHWVLALAAVAGLLAFPIAARTAAEKPAATDAKQAASSPAEQALQLSLEMQRLQERQQALQERMAELQTTEMLPEVEERAREHVSAEERLHERAVELEAQSIRAEIDQRVRIEQIEHELRETVERMATAEAQGSAETAATGREKVAALEGALAAEAAALERGHRALQAMHHGLELEAMEMDRARLAAEGNRVQLDQRRRELESQGRIAEATQLEKQMAELDRAVQSARERGERVGLAATIDALRQAVDEVRGIARERAEMDRELQRALEEVERSLRELQ